MGSQTYKEFRERQISAEEAERKKREESKSRALWNTQQLLRSITPSGGDRRAFLNGALASDHAKSNDGSPPSLERFCASVANRDPLRYMQLLISKFVGPRSKATNFSPLGEVDNMSTDDD